MDPRVVPEDFVGPHPMVAVFRNAGGRANADVVRTINVLRSLMYNAKKATVMVVHHTGKAWHLGAKRILIRDSQD
jgi:carbonic anhydrase